jgi:selenoprotein W-related protein
VKLSIEYCVVCNYRPIAASLALAVKKDEAGLDVEYVQSSTAGAFEVMLDGELIFSKLEQNRFPEHGEIAELIKKRTGS